MDGVDWNSSTQEIAAGLNGNGWSVDAGRIHHNVTSYFIPSFDRDALLFSLPVLFSRTLTEEIPKDPVGSDGAVHCFIEQIKQRAWQIPALGPLAGAGTRFPQRYDAMTEPYTVIHSAEAIGVHLWHPDDHNFCDGQGIHLLIRGAIPCPAACSPPSIGRVSEMITALLDAVFHVVSSMPVRPLEDAWGHSLDQKLLRDLLPALGLVAFAGDGSRPARSFTRHRCFFRTAGLKQGVNVPFFCPQELSPLEIELPETGKCATGLGIRQREVFAVAGSNAQGKTTFLEGIISGMDDHASGDGREMIVTVHGVYTAEAMNSELKGADVSLFFSSLPPGIDGTVTAAFGMGSGSMTMAHRIGQVISRRAPLLIIDEDRSAPNLLVRSCIQHGAVTPLAEILSRERTKTGETTLLFAACALDTLIAQADRIMLLDQHVASAIGRETFRSMVRESLLRIADDLR